MIKIYKLPKIILLFIFSIVLFACQESGLFDSSADQDGVNLVEDEVIKIVDRKYDDSDSCYPLFGEVDLYWNADSGWYNGGVIIMEDRTMFHVKKDALIPPRSLIDYEFNYDLNREELPVFKPVNITMRIDNDEIKNELIYTFTPHGAIFKKSARIIFSYETLGCDVANLYYIEADGSYKEQPYDHIDLLGKKIYLYVNHFSRYAMSYGK